jgi:hypothetical protein
MNAHEQHPVPDDTGWDVEAGETLIRDLWALRQAMLARLGVSSLGRAETHVLANVDKVLGILHRIAGRPWKPLSREEPAGFMRGASMQPSCSARHRPGAACA